MTFAHAGVFGASNIEECVLDKMKGQDKSLLWTARRACEQAFPVEVALDTDAVKWAWCGKGSQTTEMSLCLESIPKNIKVTKAEATFFREACEAKQKSVGINSTAEKNFYSNTLTFKVPRGEYLCGSVRLYGYEK